MKNEELFGLEYESWNVSLPIFSDQIETLLENGYMVSMLYPNTIHVSKQLNPSPTNLQQNKRFWNRLEEVLE